MLNKDAQVEESSFTIFNQDSTSQLKVSFNGRQKPYKIIRKLDLIQAYFGKGNLNITALMELSNLPVTSIKNLRNTRIDGYRGIWFELNQKYDFGDEYSGGLDTYTAKHIPLAVYSPDVEKTFFVYGGTTAENERHLLCMAGVYDCKTRKSSENKY